MTEKTPAPVKPTTLWLRPDQIKVPDVRVRASWDNEMLSMFKDSIKAMGIREVIIVIQEGQVYWLVDGAHRKEEAELQHIAKVLCVVMPGTLKDVHLQNLALNRLRGKTKASEMAMVVGELADHFNTSIEEIEKKTGLKRDYIEKMLVVSRVDPEVLEALDSERISVGMAYEIGQVPDKDAQVRLLIQAKTYEKLTVKDMHDIVQETIRIMNLPKGQAQAPPPGTIPPATVKCHFCEIDRELKQVRGFNVCQACFAIAYQAVRAAMAAQPAQQEPAREVLAQSQIQAKGEEGGP